MASSSTPGGRGVPPRLVRMRQPIRMHQPIRMRPAAAYPPDRPRAACVSYAGTDVHSYTVYIRQAVLSAKDRLYEILHKYEDDFTTETCSDMIAKLRASCPCSNQSTSAAAACCACTVALKTILGNYYSITPQGPPFIIVPALYDPELPQGIDIDIRRLLRACVEYALANDEMPTLHDTLCEIGGTCIQGESHRLLYLMLAWHNLY